jgi:hypothetical protein
MSRQTNLLLKMSKSISHNVFSFIKTSLLEKPGIIEVMADLALPYLMMVDYDPRQVSSQDILTIARRRDVNSTIVGM